MTFFWRITFQDHRYTPLHSFFISSPVSHGGHMAFFPVPLTLRRGCHEKGSGGRATAAAQPPRRYRCAPVGRTNAASSTRRRVLARHAFEIISLASEVGSPSASRTRSSGCRRKSSSRTSSGSSTARTPLSSPSSCLRYWRRSTTQVQLVAPRPDQQQAQHPPNACHP